MKICKRCVQPDTRPKIYFSENGICGACIWEDEKEKVDWMQRGKELQEIADWAKKASMGAYDCVIGVSGGKDSTKQALTARDRLGLRCLLVNSEPEGITEIGKHNVENLKNLGFDVISIRPNPKIIKKLIKRDFYKYLNPVKITEYTLWCSSYIIADQFNVPLIIQGENAALTLGTSLTGLGKGSDALNANQTQSLSTGWEEYIIDGVEEKDLFLYHYDREKLFKKGIRGIWLQYYLKEWSFRKNAEFSKEYGLLWRPDNFDPNTIGTYVLFSQLDSDFVQVNQMLKCIKFGFGQCVDHVCYDIRDGYLTRDEGIELVLKYDGKCAEKYIKQLCDYIEIRLDEFWETVNQFRGPMWIKNSNDEWQNNYLDLLEKEKNKK